MALKLYNTLNNQKEVFSPLHKGKVGLYDCGPTVYDYAHIGNLYRYIISDLLRRYLKYCGYEVRQIMNITDVGHLTADDVNQADAGEDKMLKASLREKKTPQDIAEFYTQCFFDDLKKLNIEKASYYPRATAHIPQMLKIIAGLMEKGLAYEKNGNVFYDVEKFSDYGKLSKKKIADLKSGARLEDHPDKKHPYDFALWLKAPQEHLLKWQSPWSIGYPGWHIECSAMSMEYLGETLDIHTGGEDHIFPHHENEIAQSEGYTGKPFSRFWLHIRFLLVNNQKMSKSKGNFYRLADIENKDINPTVFRLLSLSSHYRSNLNFTWVSMEQAQSNLNKITNFVWGIKKIALEATIDNEVNPEIEEIIKETENKIVLALDDDLNSPLALSHIYDFIKKINGLANQKNIGKSEAKKILEFWEKINRVFGLALPEKTNVPENIIDLAEKRKMARQEKNFTASDTLRKDIENQGFIIEDLANNEYLIKSK